jgi:predicted O-linked N-acetylglucosamine transferase (SPINDLY family)
MRGRTTHREHLAAYGEVDIALDPFPYGGGVTSWEALVMGCPLITKLGNSVAARTAGGIAASIGLSDWVVADDEAYVALGVAKAGDVAGLVALRGRLRALLAASSSGNPDRYAQAIDEAFRRVWRIWCETASR